VAASAGMVRCSQMGGSRAGVALGGLIDFSRSGLVNDEAGRLHARRGVAGSWEWDKECGMSNRRDSEGEVM
jgi:hypothetical protein